MGDTEVMKKKYIYIMSLFSMFFLVNPVMANQPPGPQMLLSEILILPIMALFSIMGGAYAVMKLRGKKSSGLKTFLVAILAIIFSGINEGFGVLVAITFGIFAILRGLQMFFWGIRSLFKLKKPEHLIEANPWRLIPSGVLLIFITIFLSGMAVAFFGYWPLRGTEINSREESLKEFVAYQLAYAQLQKAESGQRSFERVTQKDPLIYEFFHHSWRKKANVRLEYDKDGKHFMIYMLPSTRFPFFPYNHLTSQPSYFGDETGKIRMIYVNSKDSICPADAPIVMSVGKKEIQKAFSKFLQDIMVSRVPEKIKNVRGKDRGEKVAGSTDYQSRKIAQDDRFVAYDNGTVMDIETGLMWADKDNGKGINWHNAKRYCRRYKGGGYNDWRMPTIDELENIYEKIKKNRNGYHITPLIGISSGGIWASETRGPEGSYYHFGSGKQNWAILSNSRRALPVHSGR